MKILSRSILIYLVLVLPAQAQEQLRFSQVWSAVKAHSAKLSEFDHRTAAAQLTQKRAALLWLPAMSLDGRAFSTNDSALSFSSILGERSFTSADFNPNGLNHPGFETFETLSLNVDFPIYDGGLRSSKVDHAEKMNESLRYAQSYQVLSTYVETASAYAKIVSLIRAEQHLKLLSENVHRLLAHYSLGNKSNLLGYSGSLGIKSLINRVEAVRNELQAESEAGISYLSLQGQLKGDWAPLISSLQEFLEQAMPLSRSTQSDESLSIKSARAQADAALSNGRAQKAQELPKIRLFASDSVTHGNRDTANGLTGGVYLRWALFNPEQLGNVRELNELQHSEALRVDQSKVETQGEQIKRVKMESALIKNLKLLQDNESYLDAQTKAMTKLYGNGSVTALQLSEVLNRQVDLVVQLKELELSLIENRSQQKRLETESSDFHE